MNRKKRDKQIDYLKNIVIDWESIESENLTNVAILGLSLIGINLEGAYLNEEANKEKLKEIFLDKVDQIMDNDTNAQQVLNQYIEDNLIESPDKADGSIEWGENDIDYLKRYSPSFKVYQDERNFEEAATW